MTGSEVHHSPTPVSDHDHDHDSSNSADSDNSGGGEYVVTRSEERMRVTTRTVPVGRVRVRKHLVTEQRTITVPVTREEVTIDYDDIPEHDQTPDETGPLGPAELEVIRYEERVVITKQIVAVERIRLTRRVVTIDQTVVGQVRREVIDTDQTDPTTTGPTTTGHTTAGHTTTGRTAAAGEQTR